MNVLVVAGCPLIARAWLLVAPAGVVSSAGPHGMHASTLEGAGQLLNKI